MDVKTFLNKQEIKELIAANDLESVYDKYSPPEDCDALSKYLLDLGINPLDYLEISIPAYAFWRCADLTNATVLNSVTSIGDCAFFGCTGLTDVLFDKNSRLAYIGEYAFSGCSGLINMTIPDSVISIGEDAFRDCSSLTHMTIPNSVADIGTRAFDGCDSLTSINIPDSITHIGEYAFSSSGLTSINIPDHSKHVITVGEGVFSSCRSLTTATIGSNVTAINAFLFYNCTDLTSVALGHRITNIGDGAFGNCTNLTDIIYKGTKEQWGKIKKHPEWRYASAVGEIHCVDGVVSY